MQIALSPCEVIAKYDNWSQVTVRHGFLAIFGFCILKIKVMFCVYERNDIDICFTVNLLYLKVDTLCDVPNFPPHL
jgi:hypothetical protein